MLPAIAVWALTLPIDLAKSLAPTDFSWPRFVAQTVSEHKGAEDAIPPEQSIAILKYKLKTLDAARTRDFDGVARLEIEVDRLAKQIEQMEDDLAVQQKKIEIVRDGLKDPQKTSFVYGGKSYKREEVEKELPLEVEAYKSSEATLDASKDLVRAKKEALEASLAALKSRAAFREEVAADLAKLEADLKRVRLRDDHGVKPDDDYAKWKDEIDQLNRKIEERLKRMNEQDAPKTTDPKDK